MKKKGFTLVELLAVIVILAVILTIAVPAVKKTVDSAKKKSAENDALMIKNIAEKYYTSNLDKDEEITGVDLSSNTLSYSGKKPTKGYLYFTEDGIAYGKMYINGYCVEVKSDGTNTSEKIDEENCQVIPDTDLSCFEIYETELVRYKCYKGNTYNLPAVTNVVIPDGITRISPNAFFKKNLTSVTIPNSVTDIWDYAFSDNKLTSVTIPNSVTTIGRSAFYNNQLTNVTIPNSVTTIGNSAFENNQLTSVTIPNSVTTIGRSAFENNQLTNVTIQNGVKTIGRSAFYNNQLTNVTIPNSVTTIGRSAFSDNQLTSVTIQNGVTTIDNWAFLNNQLTSVTIPNSVTTIESTAFFNNPNLKTITIDNAKGAISGSPWGATNATINYLR